MDSTIQAILGKIWSKNAPDIQPGLTEVHGEYLVRVSGCVEKGVDSFAIPTVQHPPDQHPRLLLREARG